MVRAFWAWAVLGASLLAGHPTAYSQTADIDDAQLAQVEPSALDTTQVNTLLVGESRAYSLGGSVDVISLNPEVLTATATGGGFRLDPSGEGRLGNVTVLLIQPSGVQTLLFRVDRAVPVRGQGVNRVDTRNHQGLAYRGIVRLNLNPDVPTRVDQVHQVTGLVSTEHDEFRGIVMSQRPDGQAWQLPIVQFIGRHRRQGIRWQIGRSFMQNPTDLVGAGGIQFNGVQALWEPPGSPGTLQVFGGAASPSSCCKLAAPRTYLTMGGAGTWRIGEFTYTRVQVGGITEPNRRRTRGFGSASIDYRRGALRMGATAARAGEGSGGGAHLDVVTERTRFVSQVWARQAEYLTAPNAPQFNVVGGRTNLTHRLGRFTPGLSGSALTQRNPGGSEQLVLSGGGRLGVNLVRGANLNLSARRLFTRTDLNGGRTERLGYVAGSSLSLRQRKTTFMASAQALQRGNGDPTQLTGGARLVSQLSDPLRLLASYQIRQYGKEEQATLRQDLTASTLYQGNRLSWGLGSGISFINISDALNVRPFVFGSARLRVFDGLSFDALVQQDVPVSGTLANTRLQLGVTLIPFGLLGDDALRPRGRVAGNVYIDSNLNGVQDPDEPMVSGGDVLLGGSEGVEVQPDGSFRFRRLNPGEYTIDGTAPGMVVIPDADPVPVRAFQRTRRDVRMRHSVRIDAFAFVDTNANGTFEMGESGVPIPRMTLQNLDTDEQFTVSIVGGRGSAVGVPPGRYKASFQVFDLPSGYLADQIETTVQAVPGEITRIYFPFRATRVVGGTVWNDVDGNGSPRGARDRKQDGVTVTMGDQTLSSGPDGRFIFRDPPAGRYQIYADRPHLPLEVVIPDRPSEQLGLDLVLINLDTIGGLAEVDGYVPFIDRETRQPVFDETLGRNVVVDPTNGLPATVNPRNGNLEPWYDAPAIADAEPYLDPQTEQPVFDVASDRPVVIDPATGLPALIDLETGAFVAWNPVTGSTDAGEPAVADLDVQPYLDPETAQPVIDPVTDRPVVVDPASGLPSLQDPQTGEFVAWTDPGSSVDAGEPTVATGEAPVFVDPETERPVIDPVSERPVVLDPASGLPALRDPVTGTFEPWRPPAGMEVTLPPYLDPETGEAIVDPVSGRTVVIDPVTERPALRDVDTGTFEPFEIDAMVDAEPTPVIDPETGEAVVDPETGEPVVIDPDTGLPSIRDPRNGQLVAWSPPELPEYEPLLNPDGTRVFDREGNAVLLDDQGRTIVVNPDTNEARVIVLDTGPPRLARIRVTPENMILAPLEVVQLNASGAFTDRAVRDLTGDAEWASSRPEVASIDPTGRLRANRVGFTEISATVDAVSSDVVRVEVVDVPVVGLNLDPAEITLQPDDVAQLTADAIYTDGRIADVSDAIRWFADDRSIATVNRRGEVTGVSPGTTTVAGEFQGVRARAVEVTVGDLNVLRLVLQGADTSYSSGEIITPTVLAVLPSGVTRDVSEQVTWEVSDRLVVAVNRDGELRARGEGTVDIVAKWGRGESDAFTVSVTDASPIGMTLFPPVPALVVGSTEQLAATAVYGDGSAREITTYAEWVSSDPSVVEAGPNGSIRALAVGTAEITARRGDVRTDPLSIRVLNPDTAAITLEPRDVAIQVGAEASIQAFAVADSDRIDVTDTATWQSSDATVVSVDSSGRVTGEAPGSARVFARWGNMITPNANVDVTLPDVLMVTGDPLIERLPIGAEVDLGASAVLMDGSFVDVKSSISWDSSDSRVVAVRGTTLVAQSRGTATITGSLDGNTTQPMVIEVTDVRVDGLAIANVPTLTVGSQQPVFVTANLADGSSLDLTWSVDWSTSDPGVLAIQGNNTLRATGEGTAELTATFGDVTVSIEVTVRR